MQAHPGDVVRMFPDYADSVLWYPYPVDYAESGLEEDLVADLQAWEDAYYAGLSDFTWRSPELQRTHRAEGYVLARRVANALGEDFAVECEDRTFRGKGPAHTPAAAVAFSALAAAEQAQQDRINAIVAQGGELRWRA